MNSFSSKHKKKSTDFNKFWRSSKARGRKSNGEVPGEEIRE